MRSNLLAWATSAPVPELVDYSRENINDIVSRCHDTDTSGSSVGSGQGLQRNQSSSPSPVDLGIDLVVQVRTWQEVRVDDFRHSEACCKKCVAIAVQGMLDRRAAAAAASAAPPCVYVTSDNHTVSVIMSKWLRDEFTVNVVMNLIANGSPISKDSTHTGHVLNDARNRFDSFGCACSETGG